ncbi:hypothetical protein FB45DRAFT_437077 [Roridomyces roridus]|uniref:Uncharacterized protein n=1 Tax=Roridomyces roridus TaxID=1738132 RepID=A0AAD7B0Q9_9AGAR|nr:hypothetical protein FB45DRAFT_437077 [Roridomyces roridus]
MPRPISIALGSTNALGTTNGGSCCAVEWRREGGRPALCPARKSSEASTSVSNLNARFIQPSLCSSIPLPLRTVRSESCLELKVWEGWPCVERRELLVGARRPGHRCHSDLRATMTARPTADLSDTLDDNSTMHCNSRLSQAIIASLRSIFRIGHDLSPL